MRFKTKDLALVIVFAALYAVLSVIPLFPVIGIGGKYFTVAVVMAPLVGLIIGPYLGALAASIGGFIAWSLTQFGPLFAFSFVPGAATAFCSGYLNRKGWKRLALIYFFLFLALEFYPTIGPMWLYPQYIWFHLLGLIVLIFQTRLKNIKHLSQQDFLLELSLEVGTISFVATLFGHMIGGLLYNAIYFPEFPNVDYWRSLWQVLVVVYPLERTIVVVISILIGAPLIKTLRAHGFEIGGK